MSLTSLSLLTVFAFSGCLGRQATPVPDEPQLEAVQENVVLLPSVTLPESSLELTAPEGWGFNPDPHHVTAEGRPVDSNEDIPVILVQEQPLMEELTMQDVVSGFTRFLPRSIQDPKITQDQAVELNLSGVEAYEVAYTGVLAGIQVTVSQILLKTDAWLVVITRMSETDLYARYQPSFDQMIQDLKLPAAAIDQPSD